MSLELRILSFRPEYWAAHTPHKHKPSVWTMTAKVNAPLRSQVKDLTQTIRETLNGRRRPQSSFENNRWDRRCSFTLQQSTCKEFGFCHFFYESIRIGTKISRLCPKPFGCCSSLELLVAYSLQPSLQFCITLFQQQQHLLQNKIKQHECRISSTTDDHWPLQPWRVPRQNTSPSAPIL